MLQVIERDKWKLFFFFYFNLIFQFKVSPAGQKTNRARGKVNQIAAFNQPMQKLFM